VAKKKKRRYFTGYHYYQTQGYLIIPASVTYTCKQAQLEELFLSKSD